MKKIGLICATLLAGLSLPVSKERINRVNLELINTILGIIASVASIFAATTCVHISKTLNQSNSNNKVKQNAKTKSGNINQKNVR